MAFCGAWEAIGWLAVLFLFVQNIIDFKWVSFSFPINIYQNIIICCVYELLNLLKVIQNTSLIRIASNFHHVISYFDNQFCYNIIFVKYLQIYSISVYDGIYYILPLLWGAGMTSEIFTSSLLVSRDLRPCTIFSYFLLFKDFLYFIVFFRI